jgi:hypothetical protein
MGERRYACTVLVGKFDRKRPLGRPRRRLEKISQWIFNEIGWRGADWIDLAQDREKLRAVVNAVINIRAA